MVVLPGEDGEGKTGVKPPLYDPPISPLFPFFSPPVEAAEDGGEPRHQIGHGEPVRGVFPDELQRPTPAGSLAQEQLLRGLENTCNPPTRPVNGRTHSRFPTGELFNPPREAAGRCWGRGGHTKPRSHSPPLHLQRWEGAGGDFGGGGMLPTAGALLAGPLLKPKPPKSLFSKWQDFGVWVF